MNELELFIEQRSIDAEVIELNGKTNTVSQAASSLNTDKKNIIKSLVIKAGEEKIVTVLRGDKRADFERIAEEFEVEDVNMASRKEVKRVTGYDVGEVPPVGTGLKKVVDKEVLERDIVFGGGGGRKKMIKIDPRFIVDEDTVVSKVSED